MNNIQKLLDAMLTPLQDVENALMQCLNDRTIDNSTGINLDVIGKLVGEPRGTYPDDATYRLAIRARIQANRSSGNVETLIKIARLIVNDDAMHIAMENHGQATLLMRLEDIFFATSGIPDLLLRFVKDAQAGGVRADIQYGATVPAGWFRWDTTSLGWDQGKLVGSIS
jgi:hypothetical protein